MGEREAIRTALALPKRCLRCTAATSGVSARRVADELRSAVSEGAEVLTHEGRCRDCGEYRFLLTVPSGAQSNPPSMRDRIA